MASPTSRDKPTERESTAAGEAKRDLARPRSPGALARREDLLPGIYGSPFTLMSRFWNDMDRLFDEFGFGTGLTRPAYGQELGFSGPGGPMFRPKLDVFRRGNELIVQADLPGLKRDEVEVSVQDGQLVLQGERKHEQHGDEQGYQRIERSYGRFVRVIPLPEGTREDQVRAKFRNGELEVLIPISEPALRGRKIEIEESSGRAESGTRATSESSTEMHRESSPGRM